MDHDHAHYARGHVQFESGLVHVLVHVTLVPGAATLQPWRGRCARSTIPLCALAQITPPAAREIADRIFGGVVESRNYSLPRIEAELQRPSLVASGAAEREKKKRV